MAAQLGAEGPGEHYHDCWPNCNRRGNWGTPEVTADEPIDSNAEMDDKLAQQYVAQPQQDALQQFWATEFAAPTGFSLPSTVALASGYPSLTVPLVVKDGISTSLKGLFGTLGNVYTQAYVGINGDNGNAPNIYYQVANNEADPVPNRCGGP